MNKIVIVSILFCASLILVASIATTPIRHHIKATHIDVSTGQPRDIPLSIDAGDALVQVSTEVLYVSTEPYVNDRDNRNLHPKDYYSEHKLRRFISAAVELVNTGRIEAHKCVINMILTDRDMTAFDGIISTVLSFVKIRAEHNPTQSKLLLQRRLDIVKMICTIVLRDEFSTKHNKADLATCRDV